MTYTLKRIFCMFLFLLAGNYMLQAQYISRSEPLPYVCPSVCQGGTTVLRIFQIQNIPNGQRIQALLSNASGSFASGTQVLEVDRYSTNGGTTWQNGPYVVSGNVSELQVEVTIPPATPAGGAYKVRIRTSGGYVSPEVYQCPGSGITVTPFVAPLQPVAQTAAGSGQWIGHVYTWVPSIPGLLNTQALVDAQDFFNTANYKGHVLYNNLSFDINLSSDGGVPGTWQQGTSMGCGTSYLQNFSMRLLRRETFSPGLYRFEISGDDGIRLSIDGGANWLLSSFTEQTYANSYKSSDVSFPSGVCLSGPTDLVIEYFQRPAQARITFSVTKLSGNVNPPVINQPADQSVCEGSQVIFSVGAAETGVSYEWEVSSNGGNTFTPLNNGVLYNGSQTPVLQIAAADLSLNNNLYRCKVTGTCGAPFYTTNALLKIIAVAAITVQPLSQTVCQGAPVDFVAGASGNSGYRWQIDSGSGFIDLIEGGVYSGTNTGTFRISSANYPEGTISFRSLVSGGCQGDIFTNSVTLTIIAGPSIIIQPIDFSGCANSTAGFNIQTSGVVNDYQWQISTDNGLTFSNVSGAAPYSGQTGNQLSITPAGNAPQGALFRCLISGSCGNIPSGSAKLNFNALPVVTLQPADQSYCEGESITLTAVASGLISARQWQLSVDGGDTYNDLSEGAPYTGTQTATLLINPALAAFSGNVYRCRFNGCNEDVLTNKAEILLKSSAAITVEPQDLTFCEGAPASLILAATGASGYQWQRQVGSGFVNLNDDGNFNGTLSASLNFTGNEGGVFRCLVSGGCNNNLISKEVLVTINAALNIVSQPQDADACLTQETGFSITATGSAPVYRWEYSNDGLSWLDVPSGSPYAGESSSALKISGVDALVAQYLYRCRVEGTCGGPLYSTAARIKLAMTPEILRPPAGVDVCAGAQAVFASDLNLTSGIEWEYSADNGTSYSPFTEGGVYSGTGTEIFRINPVGANMNNWLIRVSLSSCGEKIFSTPVRLLVRSLPVLINSTAPPPVCQGEKATFSLQAEGTTSYSWEIDQGSGYEAFSGQPWVSGTGSSSLTIQPVPGWETPVSIRVLLGNECGSTEAGPFNLQVKTIPQIIIQPSISGGCADPQLTVQIGVKGVTYELQWELLDTASGTFELLPEGGWFSGSRSSNLIISNVEDIDGLLLRCRISGCNTDLVSDTLKIKTIRNYPVYIPNSFSPNGDQINPEFRIYTQADAEINLSVYSRWGELIYLTNDIQQGWDGTYMGNLLPDGVYYYKLNLTQPCGSFKKTGAFHLLR